MVRETGAKNIVSCDNVQLVQGNSLYSRRGKSLLNSLIYGSPFCVIAYTSYTLLKLSGFMAHPIVTGSKLLS